MFSVKFQNIIWRATDAEAVGVLTALADFAGLARLDSATGVPVACVDAAQIEAMAQIPGALSGYCTVLHPDGIGVLHGFSGDAQSRAGLFKQLFYCGLWPSLSAENLPVHGALAAKNGKGILFLGQSGMGKSTTMARLQAAGWEIYADDAVLIQGRCGVGLPTWSCGYSGATPLFRSGAQVELCAVVELTRGSPGLTRLTGARRYGGLLRGFHDLATQFDHGWPQEEQWRLRQMAMGLSGKMVAALACYRLTLNLENEFIFLLEELL